jgi:hypothetical protein
MKFNVVHKETYKLTEPSLESFKERILEHLEEEMYDSGELREDEDFPYTINDISDDIVRESLAVVIQDAFECNYCYQGGVYFDDYFGSVSLDCGEDDVSDAVYEAVALWRDKMEV